MSLSTRHDGGEAVSDECKTDMLKCQWRDHYYGYICEGCGQFIPFGSEPWMPLDDSWQYAHAPEPEPEPPAPPDDWDEGNDDDKPHYDTPGGW